MDGSVRPVAVLPLDSRRLTASTGAGPRPERRGSGAVPGAAPGIRDLRETAAAAGAADDDVHPEAAGEVIAGISLVATGLAVRVSLTRFAFPAGFVREAEELARRSGCFATARIGAGGDLGLVIGRAEDDRG